MKSLNKVELIGYIGKDAELKYTPDGKAIINFQLATSDTVSDKETGGKTEITTWHNIDLWEKEKLVPYLVKGKRIYVEGKLRVRQFTDKDGVVRYWTSILGHNVIFLDCKRDDESGVSEEAPDGDTKGLQTEVIHQGQAEGELDISFV